MAELNVKVKKSGLSRESYCRKILAGSKVNPEPSADVITLIRLMKKAGNNLDQTLKRLYSTGIPDIPQFRKDIEEIRNATKAVMSCYSNGDK